jgi:hypothetical protein
MKKGQSAAPHITSSLPDSSLIGKRGRLRQAKPCSYCKNLFRPTSRCSAKTWPKYCSAECRIKDKTLTATCESCKNQFSFRTPGPVTLSKKPRRFCSVSCKMRAQRANPESEVKYQEAMRPHWDNPWNKGLPNPEAAYRMKYDNPMKSDEMRARLSRTLKAMGHKPPVQGGNGRRLSVPQQLLADMTDLPTEYVIRTKPIRHLMEGLAKHYKADLADPARRLVVEVDGNSHNSPKARATDAKKDTALSLLGWSVLRFSNREVMENTDSVVAIIRSFTTSK